MIRPFGSTRTPAPEAAASPEPRPPDPMPPGPAQRDAYDGPARQSARPYLERASAALRPRPPQHTADPVLDDPRSVKRPPTEAELGYMRTFVEPYPAYSFEEIQRLRRRPDPLTDLADELAARGVQVGRPIDRWGPEPHFVVAARLARFMLACPVGSNTATAFEAFLKLEESKHLPPHYTTRDVAQIARIYDFVPHWPNGVKDASSPSLEPAADLSPGEQARWRALVQNLELVAAVPGIPLGLALLEGARPTGASVVAGGAPLDVAVALCRQVELEGVSGRDLHLVYDRSNAVAADALGRVYGARLHAAADGVAAGMQRLIRSVTHERVTAGRVTTARRRDQQTADLRIIAGDRALFEALGSFLKTFPFPAGAKPLFIIPERDQSRSKTFEETIVPMREADGSSSLEWLRGAASALATPLRRIGPVVPPRPAQLQAEVEEVRRLAQGELQRYSLHEIARLLGRPEMTSEYVETVLAPAVGDLGRPVDRYGPEPSFMLAARLAYAMLGCPRGTTPDELLRLLRDPSCLGALWPDFTLADLTRLQKIYAFVPIWPDGRKTSASLSLDTVFADAPDKTRLWQDTVRSIEKLAKVPQRSAILDEVGRLRGERNRLVGKTVVEATGAFTNIVPRLHHMIATDGMRGRDMRFIFKHYSTEREVADAIARVFGAEIHVEKHDPMQSTKELVRSVLSELEARPRAAGAPPHDLVLHIEGLKGFWSWLDAEKKQRPNVAVLAVSHTTSDGRDFQKAAGVSLDVELMSLSDAKVKDERIRFERTFRQIIVALGQQLPDTRLYHRPWIVMGYGSIIGPAMAEALRSQEVPYLVYDVDPAAQRRARTDEHPVLDDLDTIYRESPFVVECAGTRVLSAEELEKFRGTPLLMSLGSGRYAFDMDEILRRAEASNDVSKREIGKLGHLPIVEYRIGRPYPVHFIAVADGFVGNLAFPEPYHSAYATTTQLLVWESMRQAIFNRDHGRAGAHVLKSIGIEPVTKKNPRLGAKTDSHISIVLRPRNADWSDWKPRHEKLDVRADLEEATIERRGAKALPRLPGWDGAAQTPKTPERSGTSGTEPR